MSFRRLFVQMETIVRQRINEAINHYRKLIWQSGKAISNVNFFCLFKDKLFLREGACIFWGSCREVEMIT